MVSYPQWSQNKLRGPRIRRPELDWGNIYLFGYQPDRSDRNFQTQDIMPVFIVTHARNNQMWGINVIGLPDRAIRMRVLKMYRAAMGKKTEIERARALYDIRRFVSSNRKLYQAFRPYKYSNIKTRVVQLTPEDVDELITRII